MSELSERVLEAAKEQPVGLDLLLLLSNRFSLEDRVEAFEVLRRAREIFNSQGAN